MIFNSKYTFNKLEDIVDLTNEDLEMIIPTLNEKSKESLVQLLSEYNAIKEKNLARKYMFLNKKKSMCFMLVNRLWNLLDLEQSEKPEYAQIFNKIFKNIRDC